MITEVNLHLGTVEAIRTREETEAELRTTENTQAVNAALKALDAGGVWETKHSWFRDEWSSDRTRLQRTREADGCSS